MKVFLLEKVREGVESFGALPRPAWTVLGVLELVCVAALLSPLVHGRPAPAGFAAAALALESLIFIGVHVKYREGGSIVMSAVLGMLMVVLAWGRLTVPSSS